MDFDQNFTFTAPGKLQTSPEGPSSSCLSTFYSDYKDYSKSDFENIATNAKKKGQPNRKNCIVS